MSGPDRRTGRLLGCGAAAGPLYLVVGYLHAFLRPGFDPTRHALSLLSLGPWGWIQIANFIASGVLVVAGALGARRVLAGGPGGTLAPILLAIWGASLVMAGVFVAAPAPDFPPGLDPAARPSSVSGVLHFVAGAVGFYALVGAAFVLARRYWTEGRRGWSAYTIVSATAVLVSFGAIASGPPSAAVMLTFYAAVTWIWLWHTAVFVDLGKLCTSRVPRP